MFVFEYGLADDVLTGTPLIDVAVLCRKRQSVLRHHLFPRCGMVGHTIEEDTVHIEKETLFHLLSV